MHGDLRSEVLREMIVVDGHLNGHVGTNGLDLFIMKVVQKYT